MGTLQRLTLFLTIAAAMSRLFNKQEATQTASENQFAHRSFGAPIFMGKSQRKKHVNLNHCSRKAKHKRRMKNK